MTNSTETFWSVDGVSLQTYAWNITTLGGDREAPPSLRGEDILIPYMPGTKWVPRVVDNRVISLGMWVQGSNEDGTIPTDENLRRVYDRNWRMLRDLVWKPRKQITLTKRFWVPEADLIAAGIDTEEMTVQGEWVLYEASAKAQFVGGLRPVMHGSAHSAFTVDFQLSDPYFYGDPIEVAFDGDLELGQTKTISVLGDDRTHAVEFEFVGPLTAPKVQNHSAENEEGLPLELWAQYSSEVPVTERAEVYVKQFAAKQFPVGDPFKTSGHVLHRGDKFWFWVEPGTTEVQFSAQVGTGTGKLIYQPAWI